MSIAWKKIFLNPWFIAIAVVKLVIGSLFGSDYLVQGFIPFVNYFVTTGQNPYDWFLEIGQAAAFPYPPVMLFVLAAARWVGEVVLSNDWTSVTYGHLFITRLPIFLADAFIYLVLCKWLETKERMVLWLYWASPILFFISYVHGQLDVIPMAILFAALVMLFNRQPWKAALLLGVGIATKTHLVAVIPFFFMYWYVNRYGWQRTLLYSLVPVAVSLALFLPYLDSVGFISSVFGTEETAKAYVVSLPYGDDLLLLLAPLGVVLLFLNFLSYRKLNKDAFLLILGLLFTIFIVLVPPMPGWFYWSIPFVIYFFSKYRTTPQASFWLMNAAYFGYIVLSAEHNPILLNTNTDLFVNGIFTVLVASIIVNAIWIYRTGVRSNLEYSIDDKPFVIGVGGDSGAGKNTLVAILLDLFGVDHTRTIEGDDAHKWERGDAHWQEHTHLDPKSNRLHDELVQTITLAAGQTVRRSNYDHATGTFTQPNAHDASRNIIYVGLHPFYLSKMRQLFNLKIYVEPDEALRRHWKLLRDVHDRGRSPEDVLQQMAQREEDAKKYIRPQRQFADIVISYLPTAPLQDGVVPSVKLQLTCDNSISLDAWLASIGKVETLTVKHRYDDDLHHQTIEVAGQITVDQLRAMAYQLLPNVDELLGTIPTWRTNLDGIIQLFIVYYYSDERRTS